jgi:hypothetical protein
MQVALDPDAARDREQREQQEDEGQIFQQRHMQDGAERRRQPRKERQRHDDERRPDGCDLALVMLPGVGARSGKSAIESRMPTKGSAQTRPSVLPSRSAARAPCEAQARAAASQNRSARRDKGRSPRADRGDDR